MFYRISFLFTCIFVTFLVFSGDNNSSHLRYVMHRNWGSVCRDVFGFDKSRNVHQLTQAVQFAATLLVFVAPRYFIDLYFKGFCQTNWNGQSCKPGK